MLWVNSLGHTWEVCQCEAITGCPCYYLKLNWKSWRPVASVLLLSIQLASCLDNCPLNCLFDPDVAGKQEGGSSKEGYLLNWVGQFPLQFYIMRSLCMACSGCLHPVYVLAASGGERKRGKEVKRETARRNWLLVLNHRTRAMWRTEKGRMKTGLKEWMNEKELHRLDV